MAIEDIKHDRAKYAFGRVREVAKRNDKAQQKYRTAVLSSATLIRNAGLLQALAYYLSKDEYRQLATDIIEWRRIKPNTAKTNLNDVYQVLLDLSDEELMKRTNEAMALITWLKRFSEATLKDKVGEKKENAESTREQL